mgnify:CR=1 FL=1
MYEQLMKSADRVWGGFGGAPKFPQPMAIDVLLGAFHRSGDDAALEDTLRRQAFHCFMPNTLTDPEALRAELARIRTEGVAFDREEHEPGIICVAAPILTRRGRVIGAVSLTSTTERRRLEELAALAPDVRAAAAAIAAEAESWQFPTALPPEPRQETTACPV